MLGKRVDHDLWSRLHKPLTPLSPVAPVLLLTAALSLVLGRRSGSDHSCLQQHSRKRGADRMYRGRYLY